MSFSFGSCHHPHLTLHSFSRHTAQDSKVCGTADTQPGVEDSSFFPYYLSVKHFTNGQPFAGGGGGGGALGIQPSATQPPQNKQPPFPKSKACEHFCLQQESPLGTEQAFLGHVEQLHRVGSSLRGGTPRLPRVQK